jgi:hypothetical protein
LENIMKAWEDLTPAQRMRAEFSDLYKEVTGFRPDYAEVSSWSDEKLAQEFTRYVAMLEE